MQAGGSAKGLCRLPYAGGIRGGKKLHFSLERRHRAGDFGAFPFEVFYALPVVFQLCEKQSASQKRARRLPQTQLGWLIQRWWGAWGGKRKLACQLGWVYKLLERLELLELRGRGSQLVCLLKHEGAFRLQSQKQRGCRDGARLQPRAQSTVCADTQHPAPQRARL